MSIPKRSARTRLGVVTGDVILPARLTPAQRKEAGKQLKAARKKTQAEMTETDRTTSRLLQLRFRLEDYLDSKEYDPALTFGSFLKEYVAILSIRRKAFAADISVDETLLSQLINMHRVPPDYIAVRLEIHSNNLIPADYWYKLVERERTHMLKTNKALRRKERKFVHNRLALSV